MGETAGATGGGRLSLDQLIALNDEMIALTRSGLPLERGLLATAPDLPGRLRSAAEDLSRSMERGASLPEALHGLGDRVPPLYRSVVEAGVRSGRLPVALEGLAAYARGFAESRQAVGLALWYPMLVMVVAYALFVFILLRVLPRLIGLFDVLRLPVGGVLRTLDRLGATVTYWGWIFPALLVVLGLSWVTSRRALSLSGGTSLGILRWFPWFGRMMAAYEGASFADLLALLVEHGVPYPEALRLAGEASGDPRTATASLALADRVERGESPGDALAGASMFPPMLRWLLATAPQQGDLVTALRQMANRYRADARHMAEKIRVLLPAILLVAVGLGSTLLYTLAVFLPLANLYELLTQPPR